MSRTILMLVGIWAVMATPALCTSGVLAHPCERDEGALCDHESGCSSDPCTERVYRRDGADHELTPPLDWPAVASFAVPRSFLGVLRSPVVRLAATPPPGSPGFLHASDRPLLI